MASEESDYSEEEEDGEFEEDPFELLLEAAETGNLGAAVRAREMWHTGGEDGVGWREHDLLGGIPGSGGRTPASAAASRRHTALAEHLREEQACTDLLAGAFHGQADKVRRAWMRGARLDAQGRHYLSAAAVGGVENLAGIASAAGVGALELAGRRRCMLQLQDSVDQMLTTNDRLKREVKKALTRFLIEPGVQREHVRMLDSAWTGPRAGWRLDDRPGGSVVQRQPELCALARAVIGGPDFRVLGVDAAAAQQEAAEAIAEKLEELSHPSEGMGSGRRHGEVEVYLQQQLERAHADIFEAAKVGDVQMLQRGLAAAAEKKRLEQEEGGDGEGHSGSRHSRHSGGSSLLKDQEELDAEAAEAEAAQAAALARCQQAVLDITDEEYGYTPLLWASRRGSVAVVLYLLERGASIDARCVGRSYYGSTALLEAASWGNTKVAQLLLARGARADLARGDGATPLAIASWMGHAGVVEQLLRAGDRQAVAATLASTRFDGRTPLQLARKGGHAETAALLAAAVRQGKAGGPADLLPSSRRRS